MSKKDRYLKNLVRCDSKLKIYTEYLSDIEKLLESKNKPEIICNDIREKVEHVKEILRKYKDDFSYEVK
jgi:hypothetical protein